MSTLPIALLAPRTANTSSDPAAADAPRRLYAGDVKGMVQTIRPSATFRIAASSVVGGDVSYQVAEFVRRLPSPWPMLFGQLEALHALEPDWDGYGAPSPTPLAIKAASSVLNRAFELGFSASAILPSAEGGVFVAFDGPGNRRANIECFNNETAYAATLADKVAVWPVSTIDENDLDAALQRIREHIGPTR